MAYEKKYAVLALVGIFVASGAAWWWQNKAPAGKAAPTSVISSGTGGVAPGGLSGTPGAGAGAPVGSAGRAPAVEVAKVESMTLVDETQAVGSLRSRQGVMLRPEVGGRVKQIFFSDGQQIGRASCRERV